MRKLCFILVAIAGWKVGNWLGLNSSWELAALQIVAYCACCAIDLAIFPGKRPGTVLGHALLLLGIGVAICAKAAIGGYLGKIGPLVAANAVLAMLAAGAHVAKALASRQSSPDVSFGSLLLRPLRSSGFYKLASTELMVLRYAVLPKRRSSRASHAVEFPTSVAVGPMMAAFIGIAVLEAMLLHVLQLASGSRLFGLAALLSDVSIVYFIGIARSIGSLPTYLNDGVLHLRTGLLFDIEIAAAEARIEEANVSPRGSGVLNGALLASPNIVVRFDERPVELAFGIRKRICGVKLALKSPNELRNALASQ